MLHPYATSKDDLIDLPYSYTDHATAVLLIWKGKEDSSGWSPLIKAVTHVFHDIQMSLHRGWLVTQGAWAWSWRTCPEGDSEILMDQLIQWAISSGVEGKDSTLSHQNMIQRVSGKGFWDSSTKNHWSKLRLFTLYWTLTAPGCIDKYIGDHMH